MDAWGGGAYDTTRDRLMVWGGGHNNYGGNEMYAFDIATMKWLRLTEPHLVDAADRSDGIAGSNNTSDYYHDGTPASQHTTNLLTYAANTDKFFALGEGSFGGNGIRTWQVDSLNLTNNTWKSDWLKYPDDPNTSSEDPRAIVAYDPITGTIWYHATGRARLAEFNPLAAGGIGAWTIHGTYPTTLLTYYATPAIDTKRHKMVSIGGYDGLRQFYVWDLNNPAAAPTIPTTSGNLEGLALEKVGAPGFAYDSVADLFVAWYGGPAVYTLNPVT